MFKMCGIAKCPWVAFFLNAVFLGLGQLTKVQLLRRAGA